MEYEKIGLQNHKPLRELVFEYIRKLIIKGDLKPGERLMEVELADKMGVSRTPIREAIRKLELEGLVIMEVRKGAYVADVSIKETIDILEVRSVLEGLAASIAAEKITEEEIKELEEINKVFEEAVRKNDTDKMIEKDTEFHNLIFKASRNTKLVQMVYSLQELVMRFRVIYFNEFKRAVEMPKEHKAMHEAILSRDSEKAAYYAKLHIDMLKQTLLEEQGNI